MNRHVALQELTCTRTQTRVDCSGCDVRLRSVCAALGEQDLRELQGLARSVSFAAKETLFLEGDDAAGVFNVVSGTVRLYRVLEDGRRQVIGFPMAGDFIGLDLAPTRSFCADAVTPVTVCRFSRSEFSEFLDRKPQLLKAMHARAALELGRSRDQVLALGRRSADEKVAWFLRVLRERGRCGEPSDAPADVPLPMSRQDIADFLGVTIETVSRTLQRFARDAAIEINPHGVRIVDLGKWDGFARD